MTWIIHKDNVEELLLERLNDNKYYHSEHPFLESRFVLPLLKYFPHEDIFLAEYQEQGKIICAFVMSSQSKFTAAPYVDGVSQIPLSYIDESISSSKLNKIFASLFKVMPKCYFAINIESQDPDLTSADKFDAVNHTIIEECASNTSIPAGIEFEQYWQERSKKVRKEIGRHLRVIERDGFSVSYTVLDDLSDLGEGFQQYCRLESTGWKGEQGSAMTTSNDQGRFYKEVVSGFMQQNQAKIH